MDNLLNIYSMKCFARMRNKAQMFSSLADDHYHTRLLHSMEVNAIAIKIAEQLHIKYPHSRKITNIDYNRLSTIALLHDIGHTPYGHIGERTLHNICSGVIKVKFLPSFRELNCTCGFKHNINSGVLYKEFLIKTKKNISVDDCYVIEGITKHSKLHYKHQKKYDYGFEYINSGLPIDINFKKATPSTIEAFIVSFADEIAQMFSDYQDLFSGGFDVGGFYSLKSFSISNTTNNSQEIADAMVEYMIGLFVNAFDPKNYSYSHIKKSSFGIELDYFDAERQNILEYNETIRNHDFIKERNIVTLFQHYFLHPSDGLDLFEDFKTRIKRNKTDKHRLSESIKKDIELLKKDEIDNYIRVVIDNVLSCRKTKSKKYSIVLEMFLKSVAIHISKMTDSYADHKVRKIISSKTID